jgi:threonyl-tRNA synthetase
MSSKKNSANAEILRHSISHVLATAILEMFPEAKFAIGPAIENGFYYDFGLPRTLIPEDLILLEEKMRAIIKANYQFEQAEISIAEARADFEKLGQVYKLELINELEKNGNKKVSVYKSGSFVDLCSGPHMDSTGEIPANAFKLTKISGAYWRGNEKNKQLQRIYGVAFASKTELEKYLSMLAEAEKRDHRKIGKELDLFHIDEKVGIGLPLWHPKGALLWRIVEDYWYSEHLKNGYELVRSPHIGNRSLWETSGHWGFYNSSMYPSMEIGQTLEDKQKNIKPKESEEFLLKPMNCPFHVQIYKNNLKSYREFPLRWAECGTVYRYEKKGELSGLTRVRGFTQDDAHIFCRADQVEEELKKVVDFILFIFKSFGFDVDLINVYLSLRDPKNKEKYAGNDKGWEFTQDILRKVAKEKKLNFTEEEGEAAFYGPKLDFKLRDVIGREWQCSTLQFDFNLPERFDMTFINNKGEEEKPYVLHRALFGSFERFLALLTEHYAGAFPTWLSPVQVAVIPISEKFLSYAEKINIDLKNNNIRTKIYAENESLSKRIRETEKQKIPYTLVVGEKEANNKILAVRKRGEEKKQEIMNMTEFLKNIKQVIKEKK